MFTLSLLLHFTTIWICILFNLIFHLQSLMNSSFLLNKLYYIIKHVTTLWFNICFITHLNMIFTHFFYVYWIYCNFFITYSLSASYFIYTNSIPWAHLVYAIISFHNTLNLCHISSLHYNYMTCWLFQAFILFWSIDFVSLSYYSLYHYLFININFNFKSMIFIMTYSYKFFLNSVYFRSISGLHICFFYFHISYVQSDPFNYVFYLEYIFLKKYL